MRIFIYSIFLAVSFFHFSCIRKGACNKTPITTTSGLFFYIKNKLTGIDYYTSQPGPFTVPDSVKLLNLRTGDFLQLSAHNNHRDLIFLAKYIQNSGVTDSLVFFFGASVPDTLLVQTGFVNGWRGDECPTVKDAGIIKVSLRNQVLLQTIDDGGIFSLSK